jgi:hypothetical protein
MWATVVSNDGTVCAVAFSGSAFTDQWLGSRVISAQKANTANAFNLGSGTPAKSAFPHGLALSTANLYSAVQPGGSHHQSPTRIWIRWRKATFMHRLSTWGLIAPSAYAMRKGVGGCNRASTSPS